MVFSIACCWMVIGIYLSSSSFSVHTYQSRLTTAEEIFTAKLICKPDHVAYSICCMVTMYNGHNCWCINPKPMWPNCFALTLSVGVAARTLTSPLNIYTVVTNESQWKDTIDPIMLKEGDSANLTTWIPWWKLYTRKIFSKE